MGNVLVQIIFYALATLTMGWTVSLTYTYLSVTLRLDPISTALALSVFDGGMLAWMFVFMRHAKGFGQRSVSLIMTIWDLLGVGLMTLAEVLIGSGQTLTIAPKELGAWSLWAIALWTFANSAAIVAFHLLGPDNLLRMKKRGAQDKIESETLKQLDAKAGDIAAQAADIASGRLLIETLRELGLDDSKLAGRPQAQAEPPAQGEDLQMRPRRLRGYRRRLQLGAPAARRNGTAFAAETDSGPKGPKEN